MPQNKGNSILDGIEAHLSRNVLAYYTPGHKAGRALAPKFKEFFCKNSLAVDLGFMGPLDDLHAPKGIIAEAEANMARLFGARHSFFLTNGSTAGLQALMLAALGPGTTVLIPRNVHRAVMHGMILSGALPRFIDPGIDPDTGLPLPLSADAIDRATMNGVAAVIPVSPTYHGYIANIAELAKRARALGAWVFVDEAHGAHVPFLGLGPVSGLAAGAHAVVQSAHKTLQAFTPGALLHLGADGPDPDRVRAALRLTQSSSANYGLLASLENTRAYMATQGSQRLRAVMNDLKVVRERLNESPLLHAPCPERPLPPGVAAIDPTKLFIDVRRTGLSGYEFARRLYETGGVGVELATDVGVLLIVTAADSADDLAELVDRLLVFTQSIGQLEPAQTTSHQALPTIAGPCETTPRDAYFAASERVDFLKSAGRIAAEAVVPYPPGVASLWPGERICGDLLTYRTRTRSSGVSVQASDPSLETLLVLR